MSNSLKKMSDSFKKMSNSLIFCELPEQIAHGCSFLVSNLSDLLTSLIFGEQPEQFAHNAHPKRGNEQIAHFLNKKTYIKHTKI